MSGRIRSIKPEWLEDERLYSASAEARVLSVSLILLADDYGNGRAGLRGLAGRVFPGQDPAIAARALSELEEWFVLVYSVDGQTYFHIRNWEKHQRVDHPGKPAVPGPPEDSRESRESSRESRPRAGARTSAPSPIPSVAPSPPDLISEDLPDRSGSRDAPSGTRIKAAERALEPASVGGWRGPTEAHKIQAFQLRVDCDAAAEKMRNWALSAGALSADWDARFKNWLTDEAQRSAPGRKARASPRSDGGMGLDAMHERVLRIAAEEKAKAV